MKYISFFFNNIDNYFLKLKKKIDIPPYGEIASTPRDASVITFV